MFLIKSFILIACIKIILGQDCTLKSTFIIVPVLKPPQTASTECTTKPACGATLENNVVSLPTSLFDQQYKNDWNNYTSTMLVKCAWSCRSMAQCVGFNFRASKTLDGDDVYCHLFQSQPMLYLSDDDCIFYEVGGSLLNGNTITKTSYDSLKIITTVTTDFINILDNLSKFRNLNSCHDISKFQTGKPMPCSNINMYNVPNGQKPCGSYLGNKKWITFQRRMDGSVNFFRNWTDYKIGFGNTSGEFWLGNEKLYQITSLDRYKLLVVLEDFEGNIKCAAYDNFKIGSPSTFYKLTVGSYSGDAGDSLSAHNDMAFSTPDADHDTYGKNCADEFKGAWWYAACHQSNLNGLYLKGFHSTFADGVNWLSFRGYNYSLKFTEMKITLI